MCRYAHNWTWDWRVLISFIKWLVMTCKIIQHLYMFSLHFKGVILISPPYIINLWHRTHCPGATTKKEVQELSKNPQSWGTWVKKYSIILPQKSSESFEFFWCSLTSIISSKKEQASYWSHIQPWCYVTALIYICLYLQINENHLFC